MTPSALPHPLRVAGAVFAGALGLILILAVVALGWVGVRGAIAADSLRSAKDSASDVVANIADPEAAAAAIQEVADDAASAHALTSDPVWRLVELTPWLGPQLAAVSTIAAAADDVAAEALSPLAEVASTLSADAFRPSGGKVELEGFIAVQDAASQSADAMATANESLDRIKTAALLGPLRDIVDEVSTTFADTKSATEALANASVLVPAMLGADGPRNYLVLVQNNAEWRSLGGITGAAALIHTDGGSLQLVEQDFAAAFPRFDPPALELDAEVRAIYSQSPSRWFHNVTQVPDFSVSGPLARQMWAAKHGLEVDGVLSIDPVAMSYLLAATGPVTLPSGDVMTAENAVQLLLNDVYLRYPDPAAQNQFFSDATAAVFGALVSGGVDASELLAGLARAGEENRLLLWSAHEGEQSVLEGTTLVGGLPVTDSAATTFGVFLNDGTGSKMDFYQSVDTTVAWQSCSVDARGMASGVADLTVTITNNAPTEGLPEYITGGGAYGVAPGSASTVAYLYVPEGFDLVSAELSNGDGFGGGMHQQRQVLSFDVLLAPGESVTATVSAASTSPTGAELVAQVTPTVNANVTKPISACL
ncbi:DUF4012 domain-containing protein [soil metagenome]